MQYTKLNKTDIKISRICLGTMTWGKQNTEAEAHEQMDYALTQGVQFWDTAELYAVPPSAETYGKTETYIGNWFAKNPGKRQEIVLASKVAGRGRPYIREGRGINGKDMMEALEGSLKRLQTDVIDLYQLHWPNRPYYHHGQHWNFNPTTTSKAEVEEHMLDVLNQLGEFVKQGKVRHVGLSNDSAWGTMKWLEVARKHGLPEMVTVQNEFSLIYDHHSLDMAEVSHYEDVGLLTYSSLAGGILSGKYLDGQRPAGSRFHLTPDVARRNGGNTEPATRAYIEVAKKHGLDVCEMALAWTLTKPYTTACIIGATSMEQLKSDIAADAVVLTPECLADIEAVRRQYPMPM